MASVGGSISPPSVKSKSTKSLKSAKSLTSMHSKESYLDKLSRAPSQPYSFLEEQRIKKEIDEKEGKPEVKVAPDGGWGWLIVVAAFMMNFTLDGIMYTQGVYLPVFIDEFGSSNTKTALVGSLCAGCYLAIC